MTKFDITENQLLRACSVAQAYNDNKPYEGNTDIDVWHFRKAQIAPNPVWTQEFYEWAKANDLHKLVFAHLWNKGEEDPAAYEECIANDPSAKNEATLLDRMYEAASHNSRVELATHFFDKYAGYFEDGLQEYYNNTNFWVPKKYLNDHSNALRLISTHVGYAESFIELFNDESFIKKAVALNATLLTYVRSNKTGKITLMRELCEIDSQAANYATSPIPKNANASNLQGEDRRQKVYDWLMNTGMRKNLKAEGVLVAQPKSATQHKPKFKI